MTRGKSICGVKTDWKTDATTMKFVDEASEAILHKDDVYTPPNKYERIYYECREFFVRHERSDFYSSVIEIYIASIVEALTSYYLNNNVVLHIDWKMYSGQSSVLIELIDYKNEKSFVLRIELNQHSSNVDENRNTIAHVTERKLPNLPEIYHGSYALQHGGDGFKTNWMIVKMYEKWKPDLKDNSMIQLYFEGMIGAANSLERLGLTFGDWWNDNMVFDKDNNCFVLTDIKFKVVSTDDVIYIDVGARQQLLNYLVNIKAITNDYKILAHDLIKDSYHVMRMLIKFEMACVVCEANGWSDAEKVSRNVEEIINESVKGKYGEVVDKFIDDVHIPQAHEIKSL